MWRVAIEPSAQEDVRSALTYYATFAPDVIPRFRQSLRATIRAIRNRPYLAAEIRPNRRHRATPAFPYHIWYSLDESSATVHVVRIIHVRRDAGSLVP